VVIRFKICGITREEDAMLAENARAWAVGFIFVQNSPRYITPEKANEIAGKLSEKIEKIGVFVNSSVEEVVRIAKIAGITKIQLHGEEFPEFCAKVQKLTEKDVIKAVRIKDNKDLELIKNYEGYVSYILLDSYSEQFHGGTGKTFDWGIAKKACRQKLPIILAGGLTPENIAEAYTKVKPYALDLSSGIEKSKGIKDKIKINKLKNVLYRS